MRVEEVTPLIQTFIPEERDFGFFATLWSEKGKIGNFGDATVSSWNRWVVQRSFIEEQKTCLE